MNLNFLFFSRQELKVELRVSCVPGQALHPVSSIISSFFFFENRVGLEFTVWPRLALNSCPSCLPRLLGSQAGATRPGFQLVLTSVVTSISLLEPLGVT